MPNTSSSTGAALWSFVCVWLVIGFCCCWSFSLVVAVVVVVVVVVVVEVCSGEEGLVDFGWELSVMP